MHLLDLLKSANSNLWKSKLRSCLTILAIFIGSFTIILNSAINTGVNSFIDKQVESIGGDGYIEIMPSAYLEQMAAMMGASDVIEYDADRGNLETTSIPDADIEKIRALPGVNSIQPYHMASAEYITSGKTDKKYILSLNLLPNNTLHVDMSAGRQVDSDSASYELMVTENYAEALGFTEPADAVGQTVTLGVKQQAKCYTVAAPEECIATVDAKIVGVQAPGFLSTSGNVRANLALNDLIYDLSMSGVPDGTKNQVTALMGDVDPAQMDSVKSELETLGYTAMTVDDEVGMIRTFLDAIMVVFNIFGAIALLAAAIGIINTLFMSVQERTREIGLMKALGMSRFKIFLEFSFEAILLGLWGSVFGIAVSMALGYLGDYVAHQTFLADFPTFNLVEFQPLNMLIIIGIVMLIAFLAGTLPARQAARKDPIEALRYE